MCPEAHLEGEAHGAPRTGILVLLLAGQLPGASFAAYRRVCRLAPKSLVNKKAPEFARKDLRGKTLDLRNFRGKVVLLNSGLRGVRRACWRCQSSRLAAAVWTAGHAGHRNLDG